MAHAIGRRTAISWLALAACRERREVAASSPAASPLPMPSANEGSEMLAHPSDASKKIEWLWRKPSGPGPFPAVLLVHGHQLGAEKPGAQQWVTMGRFDELLNDNVVAVAISQPGYGKSDGPPDYCGPFTQEATRAVLRELRRFAFIDPKRIALVGGSRGAIVAGMVAAREPSLAGLVLISGPYDLVREYEVFKTAPGEVRGIAGMIERETHGASNEALRERSVLYVARQIKSPTLILNGEEDDRTDPKIAIELEEELRAAGVDAKAIVYPKAGHHIRKLAMRDERAFLRSRLGLV
jgi:dipeptidyl aminopeptidase/acylaminoacyl peptidase